MLSTQSCSFEEQGMQDLLSIQKAGTDALSSLVAFALCGQGDFWHWTLPQTFTISLIFLRRSTEPMILNFTKSSVWSRLLWL